MIWNITLASTVSDASETLIGLGSLEKEQVALKKIDQAENNEKEFKKLRELGMLYGVYFIN